LLQEYFTARGMRDEIEDGRLEALQLWKSPWERSGWEVATRLLAGLYPDDGTPVIDWLGDAQPEVTADCILESGADTPDQVRAALKARWLPQLTDTKQEPEPRARAVLGRALGRLGLDDRKGVGLKENGLPDIDWVEIPAGEFLYSDERERRRLDSFWIGRYPITNAQFDAFVEAGGYGEQRWWKGLAERVEEREPPGWNEPNHPCETVSWYEAMAFCAWLSDRSGLVIALPTEEQWEKAARGTDGLAYPWGDEWHDGMANTEESGIDRTSPVGIFPQGRSPYGVLVFWTWRAISGSGA
jgi:formylglycine-generating enzyme required for sulfatase activity